MLELKPIPDYPGYFASSDGTIWTAKNAARKPRPMKPQSLNKGYRVLHLCQCNKRRTFCVHQLVLLAFVGPCPEGYEACHNNGDPTDNRASNLRWDTPSHNNIDKVLHGTHQQGERIAGAVLSAECVKAIRSLAASGASQSVIATQFGIAQTTVSAIVRRIIWKHVV